ncbi:MAG: hypothetical protein ACE5GJ_05740 [Gemmatimonadota bacterium]
MTEGGSEDGAGGLTQHRRGRLPGRRYSDEEVSLILNRALEADAGRSEGGLTLEQLRDIAVEVGVDPAHVDAAALALEEDRFQPRSDQAGPRTTVRFVGEIEGEVPAAARPELVSIIRGTMGRNGITEEGSTSLEWKARDAFGGRYVTVRSSEGRTRIEALGNFRDGAWVSASGGGTLGLAVTALTFKATLGGIAAVGLLGPVALLAGAAVPAVVMYRAWFRRERAALRRTVGRLAAYVAEMASDAPAS